MASTSKPTKTKKDAPGKKKATEEILQDASASTSQASDPAAPNPPKQQSGKSQSPDSPPLEPWMRQTVVLKLKEVDGRVPDMSQDVFGKKMVLDQGFSKPEVVSIHSFIRGMFYITFASVAICKRYWEMVKAARPDSSFKRFVGSCPIQKEERRVTI